jgi:hypothetical protein
MPLAEKSECDRLAARCPRVNRAKAEDATLV